MKRFKNILVVVNPGAGAETQNDPALERAARLADTNAARLTIAACFEPTNGSSGTDLRSDIETGLEAHLDELAGPLRQDGLFVDVRVLAGRTFLEIIKEVLRRKHDLVMKTARSDHLYRRLFFGSNDLHLLRKCPCPVWIISPDYRPEHQAHTGGVMAAVDPDVIDAGREGLNTMIMELATSLSILEESELHVVHAWNVPSEDTMRYSPWLRIERSQVETLVRETETRHRERFEALVARFQSRVPGMGLHFVKGDPSEEIPRLANDKKIEVIVMGTLGRGGGPGVLIGNTAEDVLNQVDCSVLAIKPAGFVSPVTL